MEHVYKWGTSDEQLFIKSAVRYHGEKAREWLGSYIDGIKKRKKWGNIDGEKIINFATQTLDSL